MVNRLIAAHIPARWHGGLQTPRRIVIHSAVIQPKRGAARAIANYFRTTDTKASAHVNVDPYEAIRSLPDDVVAFHCGHNEGSLALEFCENPSNDVTRWDSKAHKKMETLGAKIVAEWCLLHDIPPVFLGEKKLRRGDAGITTHNLMSIVYKKSTHWDPGAWRRRRFMKKVRKHMAKADKDKVLVDRAKLKRMRQRLKKARQHIKQTQQGLKPKNLK